MVHCIFMGRTPTLDPNTFHVELPGYEACWEAEDASSCLHLLQSHPRPMQVSAALGLLVSWPDAAAPLFEASAFGMHVLIHGKPLNISAYDRNHADVKGLHFFLHQATEADKKPIPYSPNWVLGQYSGGMLDPATVDAIKRLKEDHTGATITSIADRVVRVSGSPAIRRIDNALNAWYATWTRRNNHDIHREIRTFKGDALPFFWLAKLYLVLHNNAHILHPDSEFATIRANGPDAYGKTVIQRKIVGWLASFRGSELTIDAQAESWLPDLINSSPGG